MTDVRPDSHDAARDRILIVDDLPPNRRLLERQCRFLGFETDVACDGAEAVSMAGNRAYALILMDCQMPGMTGGEAAAQIRAKEQAAGTPRVPIIAITSREELPEGAAKLIDARVVKPVGIDTLRAAFASIIAMPPLPEGDPVLDNARVAELLLLSARDPRLLADMIGAFAGVAYASVQSLRQTFALRDTDTAADAAHALRGAATMIGARRVAARCDEIERDARSAEKGWLAPPLDPLCDEIDVALAALGPLMR